MVKGFFAKEKRTLTGKKSFMLVARMELLRFLVILVHLVLLLSEKGAPTQTCTGNKDSSSNPEKKKFRLQP
jgi:hypothetical protein